jgi:hypothetical protein
VFSPDEKMKNKSKSATFSSGKQFKAMTGISHKFYVFFFYFHDEANRCYTIDTSSSDQLTSKADSDIIVDEEATTTANKLQLEEYVILRWEHRLRTSELLGFQLKEMLSPA